MMTSAITALHTNATPPLVIVALAGAAAGTFDLVYASTFWGIKIGVSPLRILQSIASGWLGPDVARAGGYPAALLGLVSHYAIAMVMAGVFYLACRRCPALARWPCLSGPLYGAVLYLAMTYVVVPLSNAGTGAWPAWQAENLAHLAAHMLLVGTPCAIGARRALARHYQQHQAGIPVNA